MSPRFLFHVSLTEAYRLEQLDFSTYYTDHNQHDNKDVAYEVFLGTGFARTPASPQRMACTKLATAVSYFKLTMKD